MLCRNFSFFHLFRIGCNLDDKDTSYLRQHCKFHPKDNTYKIIKQLRIKNEILSNISLLRRINDFLFSLHVYISYVLLQGIIIQYYIIIIYNILLIYTLYNIRLYIIIIYIYKELCFSECWLACLDVRSCVYKVWRAQLGNKVSLSDRSRYGLLLASAARGRAVESNGCGGRNRSHRLAPSIFHVGLPPQQHRSPHRCCARTATTTTTTTTAVQPDNSTTNIPFAP